MRQLIRIGLIFLAVACIGIFLFGLIRFLFEFGVSPLRYVVQDAAIAVVGLLGVIACYQRSKKLKEAVAAEAAAEIAAEVFAGNRFEANARRWMSGLIVLIGVIPLFAMYIAMVARPFNVLMFAIATSFLVLIVFVFLTIEAQFRPGRATLAMDGFGLDHALFGPIRWDQIRGIHLRQMRMRHATQNTLHLSVLKPGRYLEQGRWWQKMFLSKKRREAAIGDIVIPLNVLDRPAELVHKAAVDLRSRVNPPMVANWYPGMPEEVIASQRETEASFQRLDQIGSELEAGRLTPEQADAEMTRVMEDINRQNAARLPHIHASVAKARRMGYLSIAITIAVLLFFILRIVLRFRT